MIGARNYPDIIVGGDMHMAKYSRILLDLSFLKEDADYDFDDFYDQLIAPLEEDGKLLFVPRFFNTGLLYYNKDIITDPNDYPTDEWTYEKFFEVAQKYSRNLTSSTEQDRYYGVALDNFYWGEWATLVRQSGGELMNDDGYITLDTDAAKQGIELFAKNSFGFVGDDVYTGELQPYSSSDRAYETINSGNGARIAPDAREMGFEGFGSGRYAFQYGGHTQNIPIYRNMDAQNNNLEFDVALLPLVKGQSGGYSRSGGELSIDALGTARIRLLRGREQLFPVEKEMHVFIRRRQRRSSARCRKLDFFGSIGNGNEDKHKDVQRRTHIISAAVPVHSAGEPVFRNSIRFHGPLLSSRNRRASF